MTYKRETNDMSKKELQKKRKRVRDNLIAATEILQQAAQHCDELAKELDRINIELRLTEMIP